MVFFDANRSVAVSGLNSSLACSGEFNLSRILLFSSGKILTCGAWIRKPSGAQANVVGRKIKRK